MLKYYLEKIIINGRTVINYRIIIYVNYIYQDKNIIQILFIETQIFLYRFMNILIPEAIEIVDFKALFNVRLC